MKKSWSFTDMYGKEHSIVYKAGFGLKLIVDGTAYKLKSQNWFVNVIDYSIEIAGSDIRLVAIGTKVDVAINGTYIGSGEPYVPIQANTPSWVWVLVGISAVVGLLLNSALGVLIGVCFGTFYINYAVSRKNKMVIACFLAWVVVQAILGYLAYTLSAAVNYI
ncbi:MAG: hypothetical protein K2P27_09725 [Lachnospiraceae bacterium]|nr:hypothetical protein [Lachnospiraceae bacterium]